MSRFSGELGFSWHRLAHPHFEAVPSAIKLLKMEMVESFLLKIGGKLIKTEGVKVECRRIFQSVTKVSLPGFLPL